MDRISRRSIHSPVAWLCLLIPLVLGLSADLFTKHLAADRLLEYRQDLPDGSVMLESETYEFIPGMLHFTYHENRGAVFGIGQGARTLFLIVSVLAIGLLVYLFSQSRRQYAYQILLGMLAAGVLGNLYDRAVYGYVRDMIHAFPDAGIFPWIFNIADSLLCTGVAGMFLHSLLHRDGSSKPVVVEETAS